MFYSIYNVIALTNSAGTASLSAAIIDQAFQLIMLALVERPSVFSYVSVIKPFEEGKKLVDIICAMRQMRNTSPSRAALIGFSQRYPSMFQRGYSLLAKSSPAPDSEGAKKGAAKAHQQAIMAQMKAQREFFSLNFEDEDEDSDQDVDEDLYELSSFGTCIVFQEYLKAFGTLGLVQHSQLFRKHPDSHSQYLDELMTMSQSLD
jgi:E3 ubiquitin-protein ligase UBR1